MPDLSKCRPGNWLLYIREKQYCTFVAKDQYVVVEMYDNRRNCFDDDLTFIRVSPDILSVCKFTMRDALWIKEVSGKSLSVSFANGLAYLSLGNGLPQLVGHVHTLQNTYQDLTGEKLIPNIYGIYHPD